MSTTERPPGLADRLLARSLVGLAVTIALGVAAVGGVRSFEAVSDRFGSVLVPLTADGMIVACTALRLAALTRGWRLPGSLVITYGFIAGTVALNVAAAHGWADAVAHGLAPVSYALLVEMLAHLLRLHLKLTQPTRPSLTFLVWATSPVVSTRVWLHLARTGDDDPAAARALMQQVVRMGSRLRAVCPGRLPWGRATAAELRADLVRLGRVDDTRTASLASQGTWAGVGDIVQARRNGWHLAGYEGNRHGPINRQQYEVVAVRDDGALEVAVRGAAAARVDGNHVDQERMVLPADYVADHLALGYASTVHAAQGLTVDTSHSVVTSATAGDAFYVGMTRGRQANTAHVVTRAVPDDAPPGTVNEAVHRTPAAVLTGIFATSDPHRSALAEAVESETEAESIRTPGELFADAAQVAVVGRTAGWLDQLVDQGHLSQDERLALAVEDGANTLTGLLRRVELAGHDPQQALTDAVTRRSLDDARQITSVLQARITDRMSLNPVGDTFAEWTPKVDDPQWQTYLDTLAETADRRRDELGRAAAADPPAWAVETLGTPPAQDQAKDRAAWEERAASVAAYRELAGHQDEVDPLGPAPKAGQAETYAAWSSAWQALGRPEADRAEAEMSTGRLRVRIRAYEREKTWAPDYVANELAGTQQAADKHRNDATLWNAQATATAEPDDATTLREEADRSAALSKELDERARQLTEADDVRATWFAHTAETRAAAERASAELAARQADREEEPPRVTAREWLAAHDAEARAEDAHRPITDEHELTETAQERARDQHEAAPAQPPAEQAGPAPRDIRAEAAEEPASPTRVARERQSDVVRIPTADETADSVRRAERALHELQYRRAADARHAEEEASEEASRRHEESRSHQREVDDRQRAAAVLDAPV